MRVLRRDSKPENLAAALTSYPPTFDRNPVRKSTTVYNCRNKKFTSRRKFGDLIGTRLLVGCLAGSRVWRVPGSRCKLCRLPAQVRKKAGNSGPLHQ